MDTLNGFIQGQFASNNLRQAVADVGVQHKSDGAVLQTVGFVTEFGNFCDKSIQRVQDGCIVGFIVYASICYANVTGDEQGTGGEFAVKHQFVPSNPSHAQLLRDALSCSC